MPVVLLREEDVATAGLVYSLARERGLGEEVAFLD
jgi:hypothetical protein